MMFSTKAEYGVRVMVALARRAAEANDAPADAPAEEHSSHDHNGALAKRRDACEPIVSLAEIAEGDNLPLAYLEHLVARLRKAGLIDSRRGSRGGYLLGRPAEQITMAEVVEALEGSIAPIECISEAPDGRVVCSRESDPHHVCPTKLLWTRVRFSIVRTLAHTTLADLLLASTAAPLGALTGPNAGALTGPNAGALTGSGAGALASSNAEALAGSDTEALVSSGTQNGSLPGESTLATPGGTLPSPLPTSPEKTTTAVPAA